jgi:hypothetical protein
MSVVELAGGIPEVKTRIESIESIVTPLTVKLP